MGVQCAIIQQADGSRNVTMLNDDGQQHVFHVEASAGGVMYIVCGQDYDYMQRGVRHPHYLGFERDLFVYDGKYLRKIGSKTP